MVMDDTEIINSFNQAKNKRTHVQVLADLNGITKKEMAEHLSKLGLEIPTVRPGPKIKEAGPVMPAGSLVALLAELCRQYPDARVRSCSGEIIAVTVTSRYTLDGSIDWTEIRLDAAGKGHG